MISLVLYRNLLSREGIGALFLASIPGRLPIGMTALAIMLHVQAVSGSFARAGVVSGFYIAGIACAAPFLGRLIDRLGPVPVLCASAAMFPLALVAMLAGLRWGAGDAPVLAAAFLAGAFFPSISNAIRARLKQVLGNDPALAAAYSLDSAIIEMIFIVGPAIVALLAALDWSAGAILISAASATLGSIAFLRTPIVRSWVPRPDGARGLLGPLATPGVAVVVAVTLLFSVAFGLYEMTVTAVAARAGHPAAAGAILAVASLGSAAGAIAYGSRSWRWGVERQYRTSILAMGLGMLLVAPIGAPVAFGLVSIVTAMPMATVLASQGVMLSRLAPSAMLAEAFTWSSTALLTGVGIGLALGGYLLENNATHVPLLVAAMFCGAALLLTHAGRHTLRGSDG